ncbi:regulator of DNA class I crossover intermediates 1 isoform X3 [Ascaphus truei]|uniref:regulator of DNA class I crossover intermediates 1 isoform X3 n=1 Tax=Ascaphus truei TaxID=8439 RepID=UPI003F59294D
MNWVGGSRNRIIFKQERRKQKEFFERKKLKSKLKLLNSTSPKSSSFSLDLLNLYVVNQIASKKEITNTKAVHVDMSRGTTFPVGRHNVELPMSPTTIPSKICLEDCEINVQPKQESNNMKTRVLTGKIKDIPLSPVIESTYLESNMDCQTDMNDTLMYYPSSSGLPWSSTCKYSCNKMNSNPVSSSSEFYCEDNKDDQFAPFSKTGSVSGDLWNHLQNTEQSSGKVGDQIQLRNLSEYTNRPPVRSTSCAADRCLTSVFTAPEQSTWNSSNNLSKRLRTNNSEDILKENISQGHHIRAPVENPKHPVNLKKRVPYFEGETMKPDLQNMKLEVRPPQTLHLNNDFINNNKLRKTSLCIHPDGKFQKGQSTEDQSQFCRVQTTVKDNMLDVESPISSVSSSYSPRESDSYISASSEMQSDDEDIGDLENEDIRRKKHSYSGCNKQIGSVIPTVLQSNTKCIPEKNDVMLQKEEIMKVKKKKVMSSLQYDASHTHDDGNVTKLTIFEKHDAWSQTESSKVEKCDVSVQCNIVQESKCTQCVSSVHCTETLANQAHTNITVRTTRGQDTPSDEAFKCVKKEHAANISVQQTESEYLAMENKLTLDMLNYVSIMK